MTIQLFRTLILVLLLAPLAALPAATEVRLAPPADPAADAVPLLRAALERVRTEGARRLVLEPGVYRLLPRHAEERFIHVSNHDPGLRRSAFSLQGLRDLEIEGRGVTLLMHGQAFIPFLVHQAERITLRGFTIDWNRPLFLQARVIAVNAADDSFDVETLPECRARIVAGQLVYGDDEGWISDRSFLRAPWQTNTGQVWWQDYQWTHWVDASNGRSLPGAEQLQLRPYHAKFGRAAEFEELGANRFRLRRAATTLPRIGAVFVSKGEVMPNRSTPAIHVARSRDIVLEDITIHHAGGMGLIAEETENVTLRRYRVVRPPGSARLVSTTADASHFNQCRGRIVVEDSEFAHMLDDAINVHGVYARVDGRLGPRTIGILVSHFQQLGLEYARPGDRLRFSALDTLLGYGERTVERVQPINNGYTEVTFTEPLEGFLRPDSAVDNLSCQPELVIRRNWVHDNRARSMLITTAGRVLVEDNRFEHSSMHSILIEGDCHFWHESGPVRDVLIRRNRFVTSEPEAAAIKIAPMQPRRKEDQPPYHSGIRIEGNTFVLPGGALVSAQRVSGLEVVGNEVRAAEGAVLRETVRPFDLRACRDVRIEGNRFELGRPVELGAGASVPGLVVRDNPGMKDAP